ncbi:YncE family protein [Paraglaciecola aestuariivivens]
MLKKSLFTVFLTFSALTLFPLISVAKTSSELAVLKGKLAVVNKSDNSISLIDLETRKIINTLPTGLGPHELIVSQNGKWAVSTNFVGGDSLTVFDLAKQQVARTINLTQYPGPHGIRFLKDQQRVAFTSGKSQHMVIANIQSGHIEAAVNTQQQTTHMLAISPKEDVAFTTNIRSNSISKISLATMSLLKQIKTHAMPEAINIRSNGQHLWYGANKQGLVTVIDANTETQLAQFKGFGFPYRVLFSQHEKVAIVPDFSRHQVRFFDSNTFQELGTLTLQQGAGPQGISLHPELDVAFLSLNLKNKIVAIDINARKIIAEYPTGNNPDGVVFYYDN